MFGIKIGKASKFRGRNGMQRLRHYYMIKGPR